jgi:hypothetical protein
MSGAAAARPTAVPVRRRELTGQAGGPGRGR